MQKQTKTQLSLNPGTTEAVLGLDLKTKTKRLANMQGIEGVASIARPRYAEQKQLKRNDRRCTRYV